VQVVQKTLLSVYTASADSVFTCQSLSQICDKLDKLLVANLRQAGQAGQACRKLATSWKSLFWLSKAIDKDTHL